MAAGYKKSDDTDLDSIFEPHAGGITQTTGYQDSSGTDLGSRYMAYSDGAGTQTAGNTGYQISNGSDIAGLFAVLGDTWSSVDLFNYSGQKSSNTTSSAVSGGIIDGGRSIVLREDGRLVYGTINTSNMSYSYQDIINLGTSFTNTDGCCIVPFRYQPTQENAYAVIVVKGQSVSFASVRMANGNLTTTRGTETRQMPNSDYPTTGNGYYTGAGNFASSNFSVIFPSKIYWHSGRTYRNSLVIDGDWFQSNSNNPLISTSNLTNYDFFTGSANDITGLERTTLFNSDINVTEDIFLLYDQSNGLIRIADNNFENLNDTGSSQLVNPTAPAFGRAVSGNMTIQVSNGNVFILRRDDRIWYKYDIPNEITF